MAEYTDPLVSVGWNWWSVHRPELILCDPDEGTIVVGLHWGDGSSDPVWRIDVRLSGLIARPFIAWAGWRWDRAVARQNRGKARG